MVNCSFFFEGINNKVIVGENANLVGVKFILRNGDNNVIIVGSKTSTGGNVVIEASEGTKVLLGSDCMLSHFINISSTDSHSIMDESGKRINHAKDIVIGNHVWIGKYVTVLKGSVVANNCILGANAVYNVKNNAEPNCIYAGIPAQVVNRNIKWCRDLI